MRTWLRLLRLAPGRHHSRGRWYRPVVEGVEDRCLFAAPILDPITNQAVPIGKTLQVPITASDTDGDALTYSFSSSNPQFSATVRSGNPYLRLTVAEFGDLVFQLFQDVAPRTVETISGLVKSGFYDNLTFHRVVPGFVIQGGDPNGDGSGGPGFQFEDEFNLAAIFSGNGQLAMANSGKDTNGSQFFVTLGPQRFLDFNHTIFGQLVRGFDVLNQIAAVQTGGNDRPTTPVVITRAAIIPNTTDAVLAISAPAATGSSTITVTVNDGTGGTAMQTFQVEAVTDTTNDPPILGPVSDRITAVDTPITFTLTGSDLESDPLEFQALGQTGNPANTMITVNGAMVTVTPPTGYTGPIRVLVGVKQQGATSRGSSSDPFDTQLMTIAVGDQALTPTGVSVSATEGAAANNVTVATFTDADPNGSASNFTASINWGDGNVTTGTITQGTGGVFTVTGTNTYRDAGTFPIRVTITDVLGATATATSTATVADAALTPQPVTFNVTQTVPFASVIVGRFSDANPLSGASDFTANIDWGDGTTSLGTVISDGNGVFSVQGAHRYDTSASFNVTVTVTEVNHSNDVPASTTAILSTAAVSTATLEQFIDQAFQDILGRAADDPGKQSFLTMLTTPGMTRDDVVLAIQNSEEHRRNQVQELYQTFLRRDADALGLSNFAAALQAGGTLEQVRAALTGSDEYFQTRGGGTNDGFLDALFQDGLSRAVDATGRSIFTQALANGSSRRDVAEAVFVSTEFRQVFVRSLYQKFQRREVDDSGLNYFAGTALAQGATDEQVIAGIVGSDEYLARQGSSNP